jgi:hypothetical protein
MVWLGLAGELAAEGPAVSLTQEFSAGGQLVGGRAAQSVTVGDPLVLILRIDRPRGSTVRLPSEQVTGRFKLQNVDRVVIEGRSPGRVTETISLTYAVFRPGRHRLEGLALEVLDSEGQISGLATAPVEVRVDSILAEVKDAQMPALRPPRTVWYEDWTLAWILGVFGGVLLAFGMGAVAYNLLRPPPPPPPPPPPRPAHEIALEKLGAIAGAGLIAEGLWEEFYVRVSEALREYFGRRYGLSLTGGHGLELTTEELVLLLREVNWPRGIDMSSVEEFLRDCDIVKFARYAPTQDEANALIQRAFQIVELSKATILGAAVLGSEEPCDV